jgi:predicted ATPase
MIFYTQPHTRSLPPANASYPCVVLVKDNWNDFGYHTLWKAHIYLTEGNKILALDLKILKEDVDNPGEAIRFSGLPERFDLPLSDEFCSLGQSLKYYEQLRDAGQEIYEPYFATLRDVAIYPEIGEYFVQVNGFEKSLLRFSEAEKAFHEARFLFSTESANQSFEFNFTCTVPGAAVPHVVNFDFSLHPTHLHRTTVIIGRNGTGKTQFLAQFARAMSGLQEKGENGDGFSPKRPSFSKVIAVSYSVFDDFTRPSENSRSFSYKYCGIRASDGEELEYATAANVAQESVVRFLSRIELEKRLVKAIELLKTERREERWKGILTILLEHSITPDDPAFNDLSFYSKLSSGQRILVAIITEIVAHIEPQSVILFDEPELHLHPEVFSALARAFDVLLKEFDSYAIIATHSALLLQETLSRQVRVFRREGKFPSVAPLTIESFGENLTTITREVFAVDGAENNFRSHLKELCRERTLDEVRALFPLGLPLQAEAYLLAQQAQRNQ